MSETDDREQRRQEDHKATRAALEEFLAEREALRLEQAARNEAHRAQRQAEEQKKE